MSDPEFAPQATRIRKLVEDLENTLDEAGTGGTIMSHGPAATPLGAVSA